MRKNRVTFGSDVVGVEIGIDFGLY